MVSDLNRSDIFFLEKSVFELYHEVNDWRLNRMYTGVLTTINAAKYSQMTGDSSDDVELVIITYSATA
ncbi:MAG: hypothetical protein ACLFMM_05985 [Methanohalobium sp.]